MQKTIQTISVFTAEQRALPLIQINRCEHMRELIHTGIFQLLILCVLPFSSHIMCVLLVV